MVTRPEVERSEEFGAMKLVEELIHAGERVAVLHRLSVESTVIDAEAEGTVGLAGKEDGGAILGDSRPDPALLEVGGELALELLNLRRRHAEGSLLWRVGVGFEVDAMEGAQVGGGSGFIEG